MLTLYSYFASQERTRMADPQPVKVPPTFKTLLPFIRRAEELDRDTSRPESKLVAYFCRQYAMELGIKLRENDTSNEATDYLLSLMDRLEGEKDKLPEFTQEEGKVSDHGGIRSIRYDGAEFNLDRYI